jgi:hypothetical protein
MIKASAWGCPRDRCAPSQRGAFIVRRFQAILTAGLIAAAPLAVGAETPASDHGAAGADSSAPGAAAGVFHTISGTVVSTMDASGYTYVQIDTGGEVVWAAVPRSVVAGAAPMPGFYSSSLDRRFEMIYFGPVLRNESGSAHGKLGGECPPGAADAASLEFTGIERAENGRTVGEILKGGKSLAGQVVSVRGRVVKCTSGVLGKTWLHLRDGTAGPGGADDLTVVTDTPAAVGSLALVRGNVAVDRDFGYGYKYDLLIEDASVRVE